MKVAKVAWAAASARSGLNPAPRAARKTWGRFASPYIANRIAITVLDADAELSIVLERRS